MNLARGANQPELPRKSVSIGKLRSVLFILEESFLHGVNTMYYTKPAWLLRLIVIGSLLIGPGFAQDDEQEDAPPTEKVSKPKGNQKVDL